MNMFPVHLQFAVLLQKSKKLMDGSLPLEQLICNLWQKILVSQLRTTVAESGGRQVLFRLAFQLFMPSALGPWHRVLPYDARVRLCLHAWARGCVEASMFEK
ncbi:hypothetical protein FXO38_20974 [Capsicum annuum]|uniref:uncharacterized protein LOC124885448 n=1 Tax=Capsicum annuum TaxID=4072 RepID=UPI001FB16B81|nr:uncharacterized protein LOC124885448 [Capsicum annuum]KAF3642695.1 hypothetical protein FXO38_20974 [Capsicum annuum]